MGVKRIYSLDWLKGAMIICIVLHHSFFFPHFHGYLGVDVFFFISGYFLMSSFLREPTTAVHYTWNRISRMAAPYFVCLILACILHFRHINMENGLDSWTDQAGQLLFAIQFAEGIGGSITSVSFLLGSWFLSVLVICSFILYGMLQYNERLSTMLLFPAIVLLGYNAMIGSSLSVDNFTRIGILGASLIRGLFEMAAGAWICHVYYNHKASIDNKATLINILGLLSFIVFFAMLFSRQAADKYLIVTIPWILLSSVIDNSWLNSILNKLHGSILSRIGRYTIYVYCAHGLAETLVFWFNEYFLNHSLNGIYLLITILVAVTVASIALFYLCRFIGRVSQPDYTRV